MSISSVVSIITNVLAILAAPIISVIIAQKLQDSSKRRQDKMDIFKALMTSRVFGWTTQSVDALNIIEIVFSDNNKVREQWKKFYDASLVENPTDTQLAKIKQEKEKLLEVIANSLGYKDKISWETIQNPYIPKGMVDQMNNQQQYQNSQLLIMEMMKSMFPMKSGGSSDGQAENGNP